MRQNEIETYFVQNRDITDNGEFLWPLRASQYTS